MTEPRSTSTPSHAERLVWMAGALACLYAAIRTEGLANATGLAAIAGFCFKQAA